MEKKNLSKEKLPERSQQQNGRNTVKNQNNKEKWTKETKQQKQPHGPIGLQQKI